MIHSRDTGGSVVVHIYVVGRNSNFPSLCTIGGAKTPSLLAARIVGAKIIPLLDVPIGGVKTHAMGLCLFI